MDAWMWVVGLIVLFVVVGWALRSMRPSVPTPPTPPPGPVSSAGTGEIDALLAAGNKVAAIKRLRELSPMPLAQAKERIEAWPVATGGATAAGSPSEQDTPRATLTPETAAEIDRLVAADQPISAIKLYRERTGVGLAAAKRAIDGWTSSRNL